jgi:putative redox protein
MENAQLISTAEAENTGAFYATNMKTNGFEFVADEPEAVGGKNLGPAPADYLCMALASCKAITLRMYVQRKAWNVDVIHVKVRLVKASAAVGGMNTFYSEIFVNGTLDDEQQKRIIHIAKACPISRLLGKQNEIISTVVNEKISTL